MPWLKPLVTRCAASPRSKRSSRSRARSSQSGIRRSRALQLEVLPRRRARHQATDVGAVADQALHGQRVVADVEAGDQDDALGRRDDPGQHPHRGGLAGAVASEQGGALAGAGRDVDAADGVDGAEADVRTADVDDAGPGRRRGSAPRAPGAIGVLRAPDHPRRDVPAADAAGNATNQAGKTVRPSRPARQGTPGAGTARRRWPRARSRAPRSRSGRARPVPRSPA